MESIVNNRPITAVSDDPDHFSALTHNHSPIQRATQLPPGVFVKEDIVLQEAVEKGAVPCGSLLEGVDSRVCADSSENTKVGQVKEKCVDWRPGTYSRG